MGMGPSRMVQLWNEIQLGIQYHQSWKLQRGGRKDESMNSHNVLH